MSTLDRILGRAGDSIFEVRFRHIVVGVVGAMVLFALVSPDPGVPLLLITGLLTLAFVWFREFLFLMALGDSDLPGSHDKLIWAAAMFVLPPVGLLAFVVFRHVNGIGGKPARQSELH
jgi:hypothetical protein